MDAPELDRLIGQIKLNCDISDAVYGGNLSLCNMLLRLRQLYYNEHKLQPWDATPNKSVIDWIGAREAMWDKLEGEDLRPIILNNTEIDPFDTRSINSRIEQSGLIYGAGYGIFCKPQFFLGKTLRREQYGNIETYYLGEEYCADLLPSFALSRDNTIIIRKSALVAYIYQKFRDRKSGGVLDKVFSRYGLNQSTRKSSYAGIFSRIADDLYEVIVLHEIAELRHRNSTITSLLAGGVPKNIEIFFRAIKDCLADLSNDGPVRKLIDERKSDSILLYLGFLSDWYNIFFPEMPDLFHQFLKNQDFGFLEKFRETNFQIVKKFYGNLARIYRREGLDPIKRMVINLQKKPFHLMVTP